MECIERPFVIYHSWHETSYKLAPAERSSRCDYTYIDDIMDGVMAAIDYTDSMYEIINLGNNRTVQLLELVEAIEEASGITADKVHTDEIPGDVKQTWADVGKAGKVLGYKPDFDLTQGLSNFTTWYRSNKLESAVH